MQCPDCGAFVSEKDSFCGECGRPLAHQPAPAQPITPIQAKDLPTVGLDSTPRPAPPSPPAPRLSTPAKRSPLLVAGLLGGIALLLMLVCGVGVFVFLQPSEPTAQPPEPTMQSFEPTAPLPAKNAPVAGNPIYEDNFDDPNSGWDVFSEDDSSAGYSDGEYRLGVYQDNWVAWGNPQSDRSFTDFQIEVEARQVEGPLDNNFGILVRYQDDDENYYWFEISGDGYYSVDMLQAGEWTALVDWAESEAINQGIGATNHLLVVCAGGQFSFYVNGVWLTDAADSTFGSGNVGLAIGSFDEPGVVVHFDNLKVSALQE